MKWPLVGFVLGISVPLLMASGARAQDWCADDAKVRERLEGSLENSGEIEIIARCKQLAVPGLIAALEDENSEVRERATDILGRIGVDNKEIIPILIAALENKNPFVRAGTATALGRIGVDAKAAVPALRKALKDEDSNVRWSANVALRNISPDRERNVSLLIAALKDENSSVRERAVSALVHIGREAQDSVPALIAALKDENSSVRANAAEALGRIGGQNKNSVPALIVALKDENSSVRRSAAEALGRIGGQNKNSVPALIAALKDENSSVRKSAAEALGRILEQDKNSVPALIAALKDNDSDVRRSAAEALGRIGGQDKNSVPALIDALKDENSSVRANTAEALGRIGGQNKTAVPALIDALKDEDSDVRANAAEALGRIGGQDKNSVPALIDALKDENSDVRRSAAEALGRIGGQDKNSVPALIDTLKDEDSDVRANAAEALGRIGGQDKTAVPALIAALKDEDSDVRANAAEALGHIGGQDKNSVPALIAALKDEDSSVRRSAAEALGRIATTLYDEAENFEQLGKAEKITIAIQQALKNTDFEEPKQQVNRTLRSLKAERSQMQRNRWLHITRNLWLAHLLIWTMLIFAYPRSPKIQTLFFWNPWVRRIIGLWYIGLLLAWLPFLRSRLFAPFRETLLAEAELDRFGTQGYFEGSTVLLKAVNWIQPLQEAIPKIRGQIVLEGESGLGKSMFLHSLAKRSDRILVYLNASRCTSGVMSAIQAKLPGPARDPKFLRDLIYSGAIDICIDGLNEVSADTRARITSFVESYFRGNIIMTTQPLEWTPPATAKTYVLQPLMRSQIEAFLISRATPESSDYEAACRAYLLQTLDNQRPSEVLRSAQRILSNPMDLTLVAQMLEAGKKPDLLSLQQQQYELMAANYQHQYMKPFPLKEFSEQVYQLRLDDKTSLAESVFPEELRSMGRYKIMLARQNLNEEGKLVNHWYFRHDKIMDFFIVQTFLGKDNPRVIEHISDPRFRGVYFLLANQMPLESARALRERLILYAAETQDHSVADTFIQLLRETRTKDDTEKNLTNRSIDKIQLFFEIIYAKIRLDRQFIIIESIKGKLASCTPIIVKFSLNPVEDDVNDLINYVNREVKISQESPVSILIYQNIPDNSAQQLIYQVRLCDHWIIIPIRLGVLEQTLISEEKANGLLTQYINRYMPGTNFFNDRSGIFDDLYFFGRSQVLHSLEQDLLRLQCIGLFGLRKSGKTSILLQLGISMQEHPIIHIDLQPYAGQTYYGADIFNRILQKLSLLLKTAGKRQLNFTAFERDRPAKNITTVFIDRISELAEIFWDAQYKKPIIILLDEIERILPTEADLPEEAKQRIEEFNSFFGTLRSLNQERQILSFLVADLHPDCNIINEWHILGLPTNPIYKFLKEIFVSPFALEDTEMMLTQIGQVMGIKFEANLLKQLHRESGGHPFISRQLASILCQKAYKEKHENGELIRTAAATAFLSQPFKYSDLGDYFEKNIWDDLQNRKQRHLAVAGTATSVLSLLACNQASEKGIREAVLFERLSNEYSISECESALRWLEAIGLVVRQEVDGEDSYTTRVPLMLKWLQRNMRPGEVKQWQLQ